MQFSLIQIIRAIRRRLGWPTTDAFVSNAELADMIRRSRFELLDLLISIHQGEYRVFAASFNTEADRSSYLVGPIDPSPSYGTTPDIVADLCRVRKVAVLFDGMYVPIRRWDVETSIDRDASITWDAHTDIRYRISSGITEGDTEKLILFHPTPSDEYTVKVWGNVGIENSSFSDSATINALGHDEYLILDGMIKCLQMEETDTSAMERQKARLIEMLTNNAPPMDAGQASVIQDVRGLYDDRDWSRRYP